jgi:RNA polymerase sigma-70 factor, ECF subfamily
MVGGHVGASGAMLLVKDRKKFEGLVKAYSAELFRYAYWLCRDRFVAEDLVQETYTRAWQGWGRLRDDKAARSWLYTILRNEHARLYERKRVEIVEDVDIDRIADVHAEMAELEVREALSTLPASYREPLILQTLGGFSCKEIADVMNLTVGAVMTRLTRARLALRKVPGLMNERKVQAR